MRSAWIISVFMLCVACGKDNRWDCVKSYGDEITESRALGEFDSVFLETNIDVEYRHATDYRLEVVFGENIIDHIKTKVENGALKISNEATCNWVRDLGKRPLIRIYAPTLVYMENRSSGDITFRDTLRSSEFLYEQWESNGVASLLVKNELTAIVMHVGFCDVSVAGITALAELYSASTGKLRAKNLISTVTLSNNSSVQDMELYASEYLYAEINLKGDIKYAGEPANIETRLNGSGKVVEL